MCLAVLLAVLLMAGVGRWGGAASAGLSVKQTSITRGLLLIRACPPQCLYTRCCRRWKTLGAIGAETGATGLPDLYSMPAFLDSPPDSLRNPNPNQNPEPRLYHHGPAASVSSSAAQASLVRAASPLTPGGGGRGVFESPMDSCTITTLPK